MKPFRIAPILFSMVMLPASAEEHLTLTRLKNPPDSLTETFYQIPESGTIDIGGDIIQKIRIHEETGKSHAGMAVFYKNTTASEISPRYVIRFYNAYGIMMGGVQVPADEKTPEAKIRSGGEDFVTHSPRITRMDSLFRHADMKAYPADFLSIRWLSISDSNDRKIEQAGTKPSETRPDKKPEATDAAKTEPK